MKRLTRLLVIIAAFLPFSGAMAQIKVFACEPEWAALTQLLGGEKVTVYSATHARQNPHHIQARPSLIARLRNADLAVCTGAELEVGWMPALQRRARNSKVLPGKPGYFEATDHVRLLEIPGQLDRADGDVHAEGNPHIHLDPRRIRQVAQALAQRLQVIDPENSSAYRSKWRAFDQRWRKAIRNWQRQAKPLRGKKAIVHHREWVYLLDWLSIQRAGSLEPNPSVPPTLGHLAKLRDMKKPDLIIVSPLNDPKPANWLRAHNSAPVVILPHTVGAVANSGDLFAFFDRLVERLLRIER
ncbi:MAG: zinc ABC transporter substrate-binding protein [Candidatus Thiosymbion ectosymbiont of Robbea hypermnestra]|nr:zinc ABC transporter substrate-binding protein [Candidatus Thiosymbion ectosymbiont of Robbea hypermnestra]